MLDETLTKQIQEYLSMDTEDRDYIAGTDLLLRLNRNRFLHASLRRRRNDKKLDRELAKYLRIRLAGLTTAEVERMDRTTMQQAAADTAAPRHGKRADHDSLPQEVQDLYERNGEVFRKLRQTFETLKGMEKATSCDRYEYLVQLAELDRTYRSNWQAYDNWTPCKDAAEGPAPVAEQPATSDTVQPVADPRAVSAARKFISSNRKKLAEMPEGEGRTLLLVKMQQRVDFLLGAGQNLSPEYRTALAALGLKC